MSSFGELEHQEIQKDVERAVDALNREVTSLSTFVHDWSAWDDTYAFIEDRNAAYIEANLMDNTFSHYSLSLTAFINSSGCVIYAKAFDLQNQTELPFPQSFLEDVSASDLLWRFNDTNSHVDGILLLEEGPMLVSSRPIITSNYEGPIHGAIIMGRSLDSQMISSLSEQVHLALTAYGLRITQLPADFEAARSQLSDQKPILVKPLNSSFVAGYTLLNDVYGNPSLMVRIDVTRDIFNQGLTVVSYAAFSFLTVGIVFALVLILLLEKLVLKRLAQLSIAIRQIDKSNDLSRRVQVEGKDELSDLSREFNNMLSALEDSRHALKKHSEHLEELVQTRTEELRRSEEKIRSIFSASPNAVTATDLHGNIVECNEETLRLHGFSSKDELIGKSAFQLIAEKDHQKAMKGLKKALEQGTLSNVEYTYVTKDGRKFPAELSVSVIRDGFSKPAGFVGISKDITERKKMEQELMASRRMAAIGELAGMVGHDLRNPLTSIKAATYYLKKKHRQKLDNKGRDMLEVIDDDVECSNKVINDLLDYSREIKLELTETSPSSIIKRALSLANIPENIQVIDSSETEPIVAIDVEKIERVFINIISNALDAMPEGGTLTIRSWKSDKGMEFTFSDTGTGMSKEMLDRIGAPLFTTKARGMGFGLAISKRIVEGHGGRMTVKSSIGKGSTFKITIPAKPKSNEVETSLMDTSESVPIIKEA
jgi:PAS domain S-box-containing protein